MVAIDHKIVITGIICLTIIYVGLLYCQSNDSTLQMMIIGAIALTIGVIIPSPKIDNKLGVLRW